MGRKENEKTERDRQTDRDCVEKEVRLREVLFKMIHYIQCVN